MLDLRYSAWVQKERLWIGVLLVTALACVKERRSAGETDAQVASSDAQLSQMDARVFSPEQDAALCERLRVDATEQPPNVLIVADASGSMLGTRWTTAKKAFSSVVEAYQQSIAFGLYHYSSNRSCNAGVMDVPPRLGAADEIAIAMGKIDPLGGTPTAAAARAVRDELSDLAGTTYVLLVTDGAPNCNSELDKSTCECSIKNEDNCSTDRCLDDLETVDAIRLLYEADFTTFVVGFSVSDWAELLNQMAHAGSPGASYIPVDDGESLEQAMSEIAASVRSCSFELATAPADIQYVDVTLNGSAVEHVSQGEGDDGWELDGTTLRLVGSACKSLRSAPEAVTEIVVECEPVFVIR